ncbi:ABC transporter substrate-binding protein [Paenibacillus sp. BC26]|uniref:ABC transporter substrate-binding protein n=1 Tax=Paenibacillus sp. BC26 TaxID=1881032 RepID=UPI0008E05168|nr:extracellular solute-binding protein [Paenibacillus sp. BC26]SFT20378.1 carbohydrate ABC transporter substrate-binding protein, CUT1 family [Paenibacillus sp. BC26]
MKSTKKLRTIQTGCVSLALMTALAACSSGNNGNAESGQPTAAKTKDGKTIVTVSVLENDRFLQTAEKEFEKAHPDIDIQVNALVATPDTGGMVKKTMGADEDSADKEKFVNTINTELMSGKGADLIAVQDLPFNKYAEKGLLADLRPLMEEDKSYNSQDYYEGLMEAVTSGGKQAALPVKFSLDVMLGDAAELTAAGVKLDDSKWTWKEFTDIAHKLAKDEDGDGKPDRYTLSGMPKEQLLKLMVESSYEHFVDAAGKKASFDTGDFAALLENLKGLYDDGLVSEGRPGPGQQMFGHMDLMMPMDMIMLPEMMFQGKGEVFQTPSGGEAKGMTFGSELMLGLNAKSGAKQEAWEFMKYLLSAEMQGTPGMMGFSVRKDMTAKQVEESKKMFESGNIKLAGPDGEITPPAITDEDIKTIVDTIPRIKRFVEVDGAIVTMVKEEAEAFLEGRQSAEEAAKKLQNRATIYLNE